MGQGSALLAVVGLGVSACSGGDDATDSGAAAPDGSGTPSFCRPILDLVPNGTEPISPLKFTQAYAETVVSMETNAPDLYPDGLESVSEAARAVVDIDADIVDILAVDEAASQAIVFGLPDDDSLAAVDPDLQADATAMAVFQQRLTALDSTPAGDEFLGVLETSCGDAVDSAVGPEGDASTDSSGRQNTERIPGTEEDDAVDGPTPTTPTVIAPADGVAFEEQVDGALGSAVISNVEMRIESATWSNLLPEQFGTSGVVVDPATEDGRILYLTLAFDNQDPNDSVPLRADQFTLIESTEEYAAVEVFGPGGRSDGVEPAAQQSRTYGFDVGDVIDLADARVEYRYEGLPGAFPVLTTGDGSDGASVDVGYPITVTPPTPLQYVGNRANNCDVPYTWTVDDATISIDLPAPLTLELPNRALRSQPGVRWLRLTGSITTGIGTGSCAVPGGNVTNELLQLVVDGTPLKPSGAPNVILEANDAVELDLYWSIPVEAQSVAIRAQGRDGLTAEAPIDIGILPPVDGD